MYKKTVMIGILASAVTYFNTAFAYAYDSPMWDPHDAAVAQMEDVNMLAKYFTTYVKTELEDNAVALANIDDVNPSYSSARVSDLYITDGVITIDLASTNDVYVELQGITITLTPNVVDSLVQNWSCSVSSAMNVTVAGTAYNLPKILDWPLSLCTS